MGIGEKNLLSREVEDGVEKKSLRIMMAIKIKKKMREGGLAIT